MNVGEYGISFNMNVNFNISAFTALSLVFTRPSGTTFTRTNGDVTVPATPLVTDDMGTFAANQYAKYTFQPGDLTIPGTYTARLTYDNGPGLRLISDVASFEVTA